MVISLIGPDSYRAHQKLKEVLGEYKKKHSNLTIRKFFADNSDWFYEFRNFFENVSLFEDFKMAVTFGIAASIKLAKDDAAFLKQLIDSKSRHVVFIGETLPKSWEFCWEKPAFFQEFPILLENNFKRFVVVEAQKRNLKLDWEITDKLTAIYEGDGWGLANELDKITLGAALEKNGEDDKSYWIKIGQFLRAQPQSYPLRRIGLLFALLDHFVPAELFNIMAKMAGAAEKEKFAHYDIMVKSGKLDYLESLIEIAISNS